MLKQIEKIFTVAILFYFASAISQFVSGDTSAMALTGGSLVAFTVQTAFYLVALCLVALHWRRFIHGAWNAKWIVLLVLVAVVSTGWSQDPLFTLRRSAVMLASTAFGIYFGSRFTVSEQLSLLGWTCALFVFASASLAIFLPQYGVDHVLFPGAWRGTFTHKNTLGRAMVFSMLVFYFARPPAHRWIRWVGIAGALCLLVLSRSATGIVVSAVMVTTLPMYRFFRFKLTVLIPVIVAVGVGAVGVGLLSYQILPSALRVLQRDATLTGRTDLWHALLLSIAKRPWLGYGFNAFWMEKGESLSVVQQVDWMAKSGHNGFVDVTLDVGILGLSILIVGYLVFWRRALRLLRRTREVVPIWLCTYLTFMLVYNLTESAILAQNNIFWVVYASTAVSVSLYAPSLCAPYSHPPLQAVYPEQIGVPC